MATAMPTFQQTRWDIPLLAYLREVGTGVGDYGVVGDGVTDDAAAVRSAVSGGGTRIFPPATYAINSAIALVSNTHLCAQIPRTAILKLGALPADPFAMFKAISTTTPISNIVLEGLVLDGNDTGLLIAMGGVTDVLFRNCVFKNGGHLSARGMIAIGGGNGNFNATDTARVRFEDCEIGPGFDHGVCFAGASDSAANVIRINGVTFDGCYIHDLSLSGIANSMSTVRSVGNIEINNCRFENNGLDGSGGQQGHVQDGSRVGWNGINAHHSYFGPGGATCGGFSDHGGRNVRVHHNTFELCTDESWWVAIGDNNALDADLDWSRFVRIEDNFVTRCNYMDFDSSRDIYIRRNVFYRNFRTAPIGAFGAHTRNFVEDNTFIENCIPTVDSPAAIDTAAVYGGNGFTVRRNTFRDDQTTKATLTTALTGTNNDLKFTAWDGGTAGNSIRVRYLDPGANNAALSVTVSSLDITVNLATGAGGAITSTAEQIKNAVNATPAAKALVYARWVTGNDGTGVVTALAFTNLASGSAVAAPTQLIGVFQSTGGESLGVGPTIILDNDYGNTPTPLNLTGTYSRIVRAKAAHVALTYSATIATDATAGDIFSIVATNGTAFTISNPTSAYDGMMLSYDVKNSSGGALGAITWGAAFLLAGAFTNPANGKRRTISFYYDGTNWVETNRAAADI